MLRNRKRGEEGRSVCRVASVLFLGGDTDGLD